MAVNKNIDERSVVRPTMALSDYYDQKKRNKILIIGLMLLATLSIGAIFATYYLTRGEPLPKISQAGPTQEIAPPEFLFAITGGAGDLALKKPLDVAIHPDGNIFVTTSAKQQGAGRVEAFSPNGTFLFSFDDVDDGGKLKAPNYIAASPDGDIYVSDKTHQAIFVFDAEGGFKKRFAPDKKADFSWLPAAIAFDAAGKMYVTDVGDIHRVLVFDKTGKLTLQFGASGMITKQGQLQGKFYFPNGVLVDRSGDIYVADSNNRRVQVFSSAGKYKRTVETAGLPRGIAIDGSDRLYVVDALGHDVSVFKKTASGGPALTVFGTQGIALGQMLYPNGLKVDPSGTRIFVADRENNRVDVFEWPDSEQSVLAPIKKAIPLSGLLIPPALLAFGLLNRRRRFFADRQFMNNIVQYNHLEELRNKAKKVYVSNEAYDQFKGYQEGSLKAADVMVPLKTDEEAVKAMRKTHDMDEDTAILFAGAKRGITKPRIMAETKEAHLAALDLKIETMDHELFTEFYSVKEPKNKG